MTLREITDQIKAAEVRAYEECIRRFDSIAKPVGSLGRLETLLAKISAAQGSADIDIGKKCAAVFCADNGVVTEGVTQCGYEVTAAIARMLVSGKSCVCIMAKYAGADVFPVDVGMIDDVSGMIDRKLMRGTSNISKGPAMSRDTALR